MCSYLIPIILFSVLYSAPPSTSFCIRAGAAGDNTGKDWENAYPNMPSKLTRGSTYYIAAGTYKRFIFKDAEVDSQVIKIIKATTDDHYSNTGWKDTYANQVIFTDSVGPIFEFRTGFYLVNGQKANDNTEYGIHIYNPLNIEPTSGGAAIAVYSGYTANNLFFEGVDFESSGWGNSAITRTMYFGGTTSNIIIRRCFIHESGQQWIIFAKPGPNILIEYCHFKNCGSGNKDKHSAGIVVYGRLSSMNFIFRYNSMENIMAVGGTGYITLGDDWGTPSSGYELYGNVFFASSKLEGPGAYVLGNTGDDVTEGVLFYNNTIAGLHGYACRIIFNNPNSTNFAINNLWIGCEKVPTFHNIIEKSNSLNTLDNAIVKDFIHCDFHLKKPLPGMVLPIKYSMDPDGINRGGKDLVWDIGAFEFLDMPPPSVPHSIFILH